MTTPDSSLGVWLGDRRVGTFLRLGDRTRFSLDADYREDSDRPVLGLVFEDRPLKVHVASVRVAPWFSNLLPEGRLRDWIADDRGVNREREIELLAQVGHDLPGAVRILPSEESAAQPVWRDSPEAHHYESPGEFHQPELRFSLAGVGIKFSMVLASDRLTLPAHGEGGDWIVKLPDGRFNDVPRNEYAMMSLARAVGIDVPEILLRTRELVDERIPPALWPEHEPYAYAIRRFDRDKRRGLIHIEDLAQVRNVYPQAKYEGSFETIASLIYRGRDTSALQEFARRLTFSILISNSDYHLKNWSLIYHNPRIPTLSPAYDLVSTGYYKLGDRPQNLGLKFDGSRLFHQVRIGAFQKLQDRLGARGAGLAQIAAATIDLVIAKWPDFAANLNGNQGLQDSIDRSIKARSATLMRRSSSPVV